MRAISWFLAVIAGTLVLAAIVAWPVYQLIHALEPDWPFHKVVSRFWQVLMLAGIGLAVWRLRLRRHADWGYGLPRARFLRQAGLGLAFGIATMLPMALVIVALGIRDVRPGLDAALLLNGLAAGALTGFAVALIEETFFRGLMFRAVLRESGLATALASTAFLYSAIHFLTRIRIPHEELGPDSGIALLGVALARFAEPSVIADAFLTLVIVGLLLGLVRYWTGSIAAGIGLHMGWVCVIKTTAATTRLDETAPWSVLVSLFDGFTGWLLAGWGILILLAMRTFRARFARWRNPMPEAT
ncbi:MAG TPA: CPBP family glutamic-type intramembrane protease [Steroidobacteraceae bacterium]|nr:CPBP family glutamic-type intramembrane protease [Steroidobacteraceae bacterium]